ncbi:MAG: Gfo/Idh/MocA family oxidoreductase, partial [Acidobacteriota bacterium]|nr:Gfo/Idh/MocA family oxidoreductase [Acidobacteriota bacterium]
MQVLVVGGGMITHDQILPSLFQLRRLGVLGEIGVCAQHGRTLQALRSSEVIARAFPGQGFSAYPDFDTDPESRHPELYREVLDRMSKRNLAVIALPDQLHFEAVMAALRADQHVLVVKPLVLRAADAEVIEQEARRRGLLVAIEYHKRFDDRSL